MSRDLTVGPEVREAVGGEYADELVRGPWPDDFTCIRCAGEGFISQGIPVTVSAVTHPDGVRITLQHATCGPSELTCDDRPMPAVGDQANLTPILRRDIDPIAACIFSASFMALGADSPWGDRTSLLAEALLADGFEPVLGNPIEEFDGGSLVPEWLLIYDDAVRITSRTGAVVYEGQEPVEVTDWVDALREQRRCLLIAGEGIELDTDPMLGLAAAVYAGRVVAGVIRARVIRPSGTKSPKRNRGSR